MTDQPLGTVLSVWAHPDDETYLAGGLMAAAVERGSRVVCVTATRGELGSSDEQRWPSGETLAALRTQELAKALSVLGISEHHWLDYPDGGCAAVDEDEAVARLRELVEEVRPDTVLTFGPDGMTGHAAHVSVSRWTTRAFEALALPGATLHYATATPDWAAYWVPRLEQFGLYGPGTPPVTPREELSIDFPLPPDILELKMRALERHESQLTGLLTVFGRDGLREAFREETYRLGGRIPLNGG